MGSSVCLAAECIRDFSHSDHETWSQLYRSLGDCREKMAFAEFSKGLQELGISESKIPDLNEVNRRLSVRTGWKGIPVSGLEEGASFYPALARREFPIGNFIRSLGDSGYTPAPDIFHDLYGHVPLFANPEYADFCQKYGEMACRYVDKEECLKRLERFFWFTVEFALVYEPGGLRIFGAGILSSRDESHYSLTDKPNVLPFDVQVICRQDYRIDHVQPRLFVLNSPRQLYESLPKVEKAIAS